MVGGGTINSLSSKGEWSQNGFQLSRWLCLSQEEQKMVHVSQNLGGASAENEGCAFKLLVRFPLISSFFPKHVLSPLFFSTLVSPGIGHRYACCNTLTWSSRRGC